MRNMKTVIFGGTTEGNQISRRLADMGARVIVSVASEYGERQQGEYEGIDIQSGPKTTSQMEEMIRGADLVIDATHPYAVEVSSNIREAAAKSGVRRIRIIRDQEGYAAGIDGTDTIVPAADRHDAADKIRSLFKNGKGNVLLTTGVRDLPFYCEQLKGMEIYARILPSAESIEACLQSGMDPGNIIAMQGPFSGRLNEAIIREYDIKVMITKESGRAGGFEEKIKACKNCGIKAVVISRPEDQGVSYDHAVEECMKTSW